jgi:hypothetical protein
MGFSFVLKRPINSRGNIMIGKEPSDYVEKKKMHVLQLQNGIWN